jgi:L-ascorbate 6-phosphate lactonase
VLDVALPRITWLGQASFLLETVGARVLIDPWVSPSESRLIASPPLDLVADEIDWVLVTHEHIDHLDLPFLRTLAGRSPGAHVILPEVIAGALDGILPCTGVRPGQTVDAGPLRLDVVPAWHGLRGGDPYTDGEGRFVGYVIRGAGPVLYHAGDTLATPELIEALTGKGVEIALLPINGRDFFREQQDLVGNLAPREAVVLSRLIGARTLIPYHWDGYAGNTERPGSAADEAAELGELHVLVLARLLPYPLR